MDAVSGALLFRPLLRSLLNNDIWNVDTMLKKIGSALLEDGLCLEAAAGI